jgi:CheY-like chemotaxis protein
VEDEPAVSAITRGFLESLGYRVIEARNGPEALAMLQRGDPVDLLLTDVMLPDGMNGAEVARAALTLRSDLKVLYYSGYTEEALIRQGRLEAGVVLLQKPFRRQDLAQAVSRVL